ncbi:MAG: hypothetical protein LBK44_00190 [Spirochaetales bacterium]|nr:hypothetical protein [Spirochaetales bacterium]
MGAFFAANAAKNRAFRCKSSEAPMRFLWAFRYNPIAQRQLRTNPRNCHRQFRGRIIAPQLCAHNHAVAILF